MKYQPETKILVVDDMKVMQKIVVRSLQKFGFRNIQTAHDGSMALSMIQSAAESGNAFELVFSDWNMPIMQGIDLLRKLRSTQSTQSIPFYLLTAECDDERVIEAQAAGTSGFLTKPLTESALKEVLEK